MRGNFLMRILEADEDGSNSVRVVRSLVRPFRGFLFT